MSFEDTGVFLGTIHFPVHEELTAPNLSSDVSSLLTVNIVFMSMIWGGRWQSGGCGEPGCDVWPDPGHVEHWMDVVQRKRED